MVTTPRDISPGWKFVSIGFENDEVSIRGINPWKFKWMALDEPEIVVAHPSYPKQRDTMSVYEIRNGAQVVKFAAGEFSNGVWGFFYPHIEGADDSVSLK